MLTDVPVPPEEGVTPEMVGGGTIVKPRPLLETPPAAVTTRFPGVAVAGTAATMLVALQLEIVPVVPLNFTLPLPCVGPKFEPEMVTKAPGAAGLGDAPVILGAGVTVNVVPEFAWPPTVTTTGPVVAPVGTGAVILVLPQAEGVAVVPLNLTVLPTCVERKLVPAMTIEDPIAPVFGVKDVTVGTPVGVGIVTIESKFPFAVPSMSNSPAKVPPLDPTVRLTPAQR